MKLENGLIIGIIPARGGSKGVARKNIKLLCGKPLIVYTIEEAKKSKYLVRIIITNEDLEIAIIAREYGADVPFLRLKELSEDYVTDLLVFQHCLA
jgi:N-acylneuraminate cytidylyltransferase/CMP-N,N'-diacetyllegionaminic acid synthase